MAGEVTATNLRSGFGDPAWRHRIGPHLLAILREEGFLPHSLATR